MQPRPEIETHPLTQEQKLDEALKGTFPASDPFYLEPETEPPAQRKAPANVQWAESGDEQWPGKMRAG
jgi:hypothetical protein